MQAMKDSGIEWIGKIPEDWSVCRLDQTGRYINGYAFKPEEWSEFGLPIIRIQDLSGSNANPNYYRGTIDRKYLVREGDLLVSWAATLDTYCWHGSDAWLNQHIFKVECSKSLNKSYLRWLLKVAIHYLDSGNKHGIVMQHLTWRMFAHCTVPLPPYDQQFQIGSFLDSQCKVFEQSEKLLSKQILTLERYRSSVIHEAVTRGLDSTVPTKSSGIAWVGDIPESWKVYRLKFFAVSDLGLMLDEKQMTNVNVHEYLANKDVQWFSINETGLSEASFPLGSEQRYQIMDGDILICEGGEVGRCAVWHGASPHFYYQKAIHRLRVDKSIANPNFIAYQFFDKAKTTNFVEVRKGVSTIAHLPGDQLMRLKFTVPPLEEQNAIVDYLDARTAAINAVLDTKHKQLDILKRRRQSLIYEYVTGKRRVIEEA